jgi:hypothetical protein
VQDALPVLALPLIGCTHEADPRLRDAGVKVKTTRTPPRACASAGDDDTVLSMLTRLIGLAIDQAVTVLISRVGSCEDITGPRNLILCICASPW